MSVQDSQATVSTLKDSTIQSGPTEAKYQSAAEIQAWMTVYLAQLLEVDSDEIQVDLPFDSYGLDSSIAVGMTGDLEDWLNQKLDPTLLYDYPTIESLSQHLAAECK